MSTCYSRFFKCRELERVDSLFEKHVVFWGKMCRNVISNFGFFPGIKCRHVIPLFEMSASSSELIVCSKNTLCFVEKSVVMLFPYFVYFFELFVFVTPIFSQLGVISSEFLVVTRAEQRSLNGYFALKGVKKQHKFPPELDESSLEKKLAEANLVHGVDFFALVADYVSYVQFHCRGSCSFANSLWGDCIIWCCHSPPPIVWYGPCVCTTCKEELLFSVWS